MRNIWRIKRRTIGRQHHTVPPNLGWPCWHLPQLTSRSSGPRHGMPHGHNQQHARILASACRSLCTTASFTLCSESTSDALEHTRHRIRHMFVVAHAAVAAVSIRTGYEKLL